MCIPLSVSLSLSISVNDRRNAMLNVTFISTRILHFFTFSFNYKMNFYAILRMLPIFKILAIFSCLSCPGV